jgi:hypothetical protein
METNTAKQIIAEALNIAISKGCFGLVEVQNIVKALEVINETAALSSVPSQIPEIQFEKEVD